MIKKLCIERQAENQICSEFSDDRCSFYSSKTSSLSHTQIFVCAFFKRKHIFRISDIFEAEDSNEKRNHHVLCPTLEWKESDSRFITRSEEEKGKFTHIFEHCWINFFSSSPIASLLLHINIIYIFTLLFWVEKLTQISTDDEYKAPQTWFSGVGNWVESFFSRSLSCIFFFYTWIQNGWNWLMVFFILLFLSSNFFLILNIFSDIYARMLYSFLISLLSPRDDDAILSRERWMLCVEEQRDIAEYTQHQNKFAKNLLILCCSLSSHSGRKIGSILWAPYEHTT